MKVDLERLRRSLARYVHAEENAVPVATGDLEALLAVVDAAREFVSGTFAEPAAAAEWARQHGRGETGRFAVLVSSLEPFTPPAPRPAGVKVTNVGAHVMNMGQVQREIDRWNAEQAKRPSPEERREMVRDHLANAGVMVQRQFRSDQERIAELERQLEAERTRGIDHALYEMVCAERDGLEARLARVPALVEALRDVLAWPIPGGTVRTYALPTGLAVKADEALAAWEKP